MPGWSLVYEGYEPARESLREALCTLGNGYFATRGAAADSGDDEVHYPGTYIAGAYNRLATPIAGRDVVNESLVNMPNWLPLTFAIDDGPWFRIDDVDILSYRQALDLRQGIMTRTMRFRNRAGCVTRWDERRLVSMAHAHKAGMAVTLTAENWSGRLTVRSGIDGGVINNNVARYRDLKSDHLDTLETAVLADDTVLLRSRTRQSRIEIVEAVRTRLYRGGSELAGERETDQEEDWIGQRIRTDIGEGESLQIEKALALYTSRDWAISEPGMAASRIISRIGRFDDMLADHRIVWEHLWQESDIDIDLGDDHETQFKLRVHIFHLLQTVSHHTVDLDVGVPARGWHGEAYRGHIFWDELFIFPFLNLRLPDLTRSLLRYRYRRLEEARALAREAGYAGAMYPWQSGSTGLEESQRVHLNPVSGRWIPDRTHRQRHINAAIAYNIWQYYQVTGDRNLLDAFGAEMFLEIARFWASIAKYNPDLDRYEIKHVMGPDEYHTAYPETDPEEAGGLDNNAYTNVMAAWILARADDVLALLPDRRRDQLRETLGLTQEELACWEAMSRKMRVVFHGNRIISQFEGYDRLQEFDWEGYRQKYGDIQRLDRILEAEDDSTNKYKASKQADVLMLFYLFSADELALLFERLGYPFDPDMIPRNIEYYMQRTSHGSTLSRVVHSWVLARSDRSRSWSLFCQALDSDIADVQGGTTPEGIHLGAMAGTVDQMQRCYTGLEARGNVLHFNPLLPEDLNHLRVQVRYRQHRLDVDIDQDILRIKSRPVTGLPITINYRGEMRDLSPGASTEFYLIQPRAHREGPGADERSACRNRIAGAMAASSNDQASSSRRTARHENRGF